MQQRLVFLFACALGLGCQDGREGEFRSADAPLTTQIASGPVAARELPSNLVTRRKSTDLPSYQPGVVIVKWKNGFSATAVDTRLAESLGLARARPRGRTGVDLMRILTTETEPAAVDRLRKRKEIEYAELNYRIELLRTPDDTSFGTLWGLHNTGQSGGTVDADIDAPEAWDIGIGSRDVVVAVLDTGVDITHNDLASNIWTNADEIANNGIDDDQNGYIDDVHGWDFENNSPNPVDSRGHGTHCSGTIGAAGNNNLGVVGVNWQVSIMALRIIGDQDTPTFILDAAEGVRYAADNGAHVLSCSWWTIRNPSQTLQEAFQYSSDRGVLAVIAAANEAEDVDSTNNIWPCQYTPENHLCVAATNRTDNLSSFSNWGAISVDVAAPGEDILSLAPGNGFETMSGTSMACPHTAGAVALMMSIRPDMTALQIKQSLMSTVDPLPDLQGKTVTGGRINIGRAMAAISGVPLPPLALAGGNRNVLAGDAVRLNGASSFDPNGDDITYQWSLVAPAKSAAVLDDPTSRTPRFLTDYCGEYVAELVVTDEGGLVSNPDRAVITALNVAELVPAITSPNYPNNYTDNYSEEWTITQPGALTLSVHFAAFDTESGFDYVRLLDGAGTEVAAYSGSRGAFNSATVSGDTLVIRFTTDSSVTRPGWIIDSYWFCDGNNCDLGTGDCNQNPDDGCETDLSSDGQNCGWCGHKCVFPNASASCANRRCVLDACQDGWNDCDGAINNGCESNPLADPNNCSACGNTCGPYPNAIAGCEEGTCAIADCARGFDDCNGIIEDGCELDVTHDAANCGACGNVCALPHVAESRCVSGACIPGVCTDSPEPGVESPHPYPNNYSNTWTITRPGWPNISAHFALFNTERNYDFVRIRDGAGVEYAVYHGNLGPFTSATVAGDTLVVVMTSDSSLNLDGFAIDYVSTCSVGCEAGFGNCDDDPASGCETDLSSSVDHCSACNQPCGAPHTNSRCEGGVCTAGAECLPGWLDCDGNMANGCEKNSLNDPLNCGGCGTACTYQNAQGLCLDGACAMGDCGSGFGDCNESDADGCEIDLLRDPNHCGFCGSVCAPEHAERYFCDQGLCQLGGCVPEAQIIETPHPYSNDQTLDWVLDYPGASRITLHFTDFNTERTYDTLTIVNRAGSQLDRFHDVLGAFSKTYQVDYLRLQFKSDGSVTRWGFRIEPITVCDPRGCSAGWSDCDGAVGNGCESDIATDPKNCGTCDTACSYPNARPICTAGACSMGECNQGFGDCDADPGDGCETDLWGDPENCGACGTVCGPYANAAEGCAGGCIVEECNQGFADCDSVVQNGCEVPLGTPEHCSACGHACAFQNGSGACEAAACVLAGCDSGFGDCNQHPIDGCETDLTTNIKNCGACGSLCRWPNSVTGCANGQCLLERCIQPFANCDGDNTNGCEQNLQNDPQHCSACGAACDLAGTLDHFCEGGACGVLHCDSGRANCDELHPNGCEIDTLTDRENCGGCAAECDLPHGGEQCIDGACTLMVCDPDYDNCDADPSNGCETSLSSETNCGSCSTVCGSGQHCVMGAGGYGCEDLCHDSDNDGHADLACGGDDCDDADNTRHPGAAETCGDGIDQDCDQKDLTCPCADADQDGYRDQACGGDDCDDADNTRHPGAAETCGDGIDQDCDGKDLACPCADADQDGHTSATCGGDDCNDSDASIHPGAVETCGDGIDQDCDQKDLACPCVDADQDGYRDQACGGDDCNDSDASIHPGAAETCGDGIDQDCDQKDLACSCVDADQDGHRDHTCGGDDCDDRDATVYPGSVEICGDGIDQDCDGLDEECPVTGGCATGKGAAGGTGLLFLLAVGLTFLRRRG